MPAQEKNVIENWSENYLDNLEVIYGSIELHPQKVLEETNEEWLEAFMLLYQENLLVDPWAVFYFAAYEALWGQLELHGAMSPEEMNQQWIEHFYQETCRIIIHPAA